MTGRMVIPLLTAIALVLAATPAAAQRAACTPETVQGTHTEPPWPPGSVQLGEQGITDLEVIVARDGRASRARITKSSGFPRLDDAAATHVEKIWRWQKLACASAKTAVRVVWDPKGFYSTPEAVQRQQQQRVMEDLRKTPPVKPGPR